MKKVLSVALAGLMLSATIASAAQPVAVVQGMSGKVLVNKGKGFVPATAELQLNSGDRVLVGEDSFATISYTDCAVSLVKPTVFKVAKVAPCVAGQKNAALDGVMVTPVADMPSDYAAPLPWPALFLLGGSAAVITTIVVIGKKDKPCVSGPC